MQAVCKKATVTLNLVRRNVGGCPKYVKERCYATQVRPTMEYACTVWDPNTQSNIKKIEMVQRRAARFMQEIQKVRKSI